MPETFHGEEGARALLVFRTALLAYSETFIPDQAEKLTRFVPHYAGFFHVPEIELPPRRTLAGSRRRWLGQLRDGAAVFGQVDPVFLREVRKINPVLIHAHFEEGGLKALALKKHLRVPLVVSCWGYDVTVNAYRWARYPRLGSYYQARRRALLEQGDLFIGISRFLCDQMLARGYPAGKVQLHYVGVDTARFRPDATRVRRPVILFVGRMVEKKGVADLLSAMAVVTKNHPGVELVLVGDGPLRPALEAQARELRVPAKFLGVQPHGAIVDLMAEVLLLCAPSVQDANGDSEGLPFVLLEAMAMELPVVSTRHAGIPEAVEHGVTGLLQAEHEVEALARSISELLDNAALREQMGRAGRARILRDFNLETQTRILEEKYLELLR